jgi:23S rRNA (pseudouridine1915-N3)-methyltransferase
MKIHLLMVGQLKSGPEKELFQEYIKRLHEKPEITEIHARQDKVIKAEAYLKHITAKDLIITLDEKGKNYSSMALATELAKLSDSKRITFLIGGADGIPEEIKKMAKISMAFGSNTWPHMFVRVMLVEQLYRAQQILSGHPYHRD